MEDFLPLLLRAAQAAEADIRLRADNEQRARPAGLMRPGAGPRRMLLGRRPPAAPPHRRWRRARGGSTRTQHACTDCDGAQLCQDIGEVT